MNKHVTALLEICLMTLLIVFIGWFFEAFLKLFAFWGWCFKALWLILILLVILLPKRSFRAYGFLPRSSRFTLKWSTVIVAIFTLPAIASIAALTALGAAKPAKLSFLGVILNAIFYMVLVGVIEEAYFRGYVQSRLNEVFEKRWGRFIFKAWRINYGVGLFVSSAIFALMHMVNYWNPLINRWEPVWWAPLHILGCFAFGCLAGALREVSGDIYIPASLHGSVMTAYTFLLIYTNELVLNISLFVSWFVFFYILARITHEADGLAVSTFTAPTAPQMKDISPNRCGEPVNRPTRLSRQGRGRFSLAFYYELLFVKHDSADLGPYLLKCQ